MPRANSGAQGWKVESWRGQVWGTRRLGHLPSSGGEDPREARASRPFLPTSPIGTARPVPPIGCRAWDASDSANHRGEARFRNFFSLFLPLGPRSCSAKPRRCPAGGAAGGAGHLAHRAGVKRACWRLGAHRATHSPARPHASPSHWLHLSALAPAQE